MKGILGRKLGMTQLFLDGGNVVPVTVVEAGPCVVLQVKTAEVDGYSGVQLGFDDKKKPNKPQAGHAAKAGTVAKRYVREIRGPLDREYEIGQELLVADIFADGESVDVVGVSKGKGTAGPIKRHNQSRGPMAHGSKYHRGVGSLGSIAANRVFKGTRMSGRMGHERVTVQNLKIVRIDTERNLLLIKGALPGPRNSYVTVRTTVKKK